MKCFFYGMFYCGRLKFNICLVLFFPASPKARKDTMGLSTESMAGPSLPSDRPTLLDIRPESVRIQWVPVTLTGPGADYRPVKYLLEVKEIPGPWRKLASGLTGNSYFATDLNPDREYNFRVRAENKFAESEPTLPATLQKGRVGELTFCF